MPLGNRHSDVMDLLKDINEAVADRDLDKISDCVTELTHIFVSRESNKQTRTSERGTQPGIRRPHAVIDALVDLRKHPDGKRELIHAIDKIIEKFARERDEHKNNGQDGFVDYYDEPISRLEVIRQFVL